MDARGKKRRTIQWLVERDPAQQDYRPIVRIALRDGNQRNLLMNNIRHVKAANLWVAEVTLPPTIFSLRYSIRLTLAAPAKGSTGSSTGPSTDPDHDTSTEKTLPAVHDTDHMLLLDSNWLVMQFPSEAPIHYPFEEGCHTLFINAVECASRGCLAPIVSLVGNSPEIGSWQPRWRPYLIRIKPGLWLCPISLRAGRTVEYKLTVNNKPSEGTAAGCYDETNECTWETFYNPFLNRSFTPTRKHNMVVFSQWGHIDSTKVSEIPHNQFFVYASQSSAARVKRTSDVASVLETELMTSPRLTPNPETVLEITIADLALNPPPLEASEIASGDDDSDDGLICCGGKRGEETIGDAQAELVATPQKPDMMTDTDDLVADILDTSDKTMAIACTEYTLSDSLATAEKAEMMTNTDDLLGARSHEDKGHKYHSAPLAENRSSQIQNLTMCKDKETSSEGKNCFPSNHASSKIKSSANDLLRFNAENLSETDNFPSGGKCTSVTITPLLSSSAKENSAKEKKTVSLSLKKSASEPSKGIKANSVGHPPAPERELKLAAAQVVAKAIGRAVESIQVDMEIARQAQHAKLAVVAKSLVRRAFKLALKTTRNDLATTDATAHDEALTLDIGNFLSDALDYVSLMQHKKATCTASDISKLLNRNNVSSNSPYSSDPPKAAARSVLLGDCTEQCEFNDDPDFEEMIARIATAARDQVFEDVRRHGLTIACYDTAVTTLPPGYIHLADTLAGNTQLAVVVSQLVDDAFSCASAEVYDEDEEARARNNAAQQRTLAMKARSMTRHVRGLTYRQHDTKTTKSDIWDAGGSPETRLLDYISDRDLPSSSSDGATDGANRVTERATDRFADRADAFSDISGNEPTHPAAILLDMPKESGQHKPDKHEIQEEKEEFMEDRDELSKTYYPSSNIKTCKSARVTKVRFCSPHHTIEQQYSDCTVRTKTPMHKSSVDWNDSPPRKRRGAKGNLKTGSSD